FSGGEDLGNLFDTFMPGEGVRLVPNERADGGWQFGHGRQARSVEQQRHNRDVVLDGRLDFPADVVARVVQTAATFAVLRVEPAWADEDKEQRGAANGRREGLREMLAGRDGGAVEKDTLVAKAPGKRIIQMVRGSATVLPAIADENPRLQHLRR